MGWIFGVFLEDATGRIRCSRCIFMVVESLLMELGFISVSDDLVDDDTTNGSVFNLVSWLAYRHNFGKQHICFGSI